MISVITTESNLPSCRNLLSTPWGGGAGHTEGHCRCSKVTQEEMSLLRESLWLTWSPDTWRRKSWLVPTLQDTVPGDLVSHLAIWALLCVYWQPPDIPLLWVTLGICLWEETVEIIILTVMASSMKRKEWATDPSFSSLGESYFTWRIEWGLLEACRPTDTKGHRVQTSQNWRCFDFKTVCKPSDNTGSARSATKVIYNIIFSPKWYRCYFGGKNQHI